MKLLAAIAIIAAALVLRWFLRLFSTPERGDDYPEIVDDPWLQMVREWWEKAA